MWRSQHIKEWDPSHTPPLGSFNPPRKAAKNYYDEDPSSENKRPHVDWLRHIQRWAALRENIV